MGPPIVPCRRTAFQWPLPRSTPCSPLGCRKSGPFTGPKNSLRPPAAAFASVPITTSLSWPSPLPRLASTPLSFRVRPPLRGSISIASVAPVLPSTLGWSDRARGLPPLLPLRFPVVAPRRRLGTSPDLPVSLGSGRLCKGPCRRGSLVRWLHFCTLYFVSRPIKLFCRCLCLECLFARLFAYVAPPCRFCYFFGRSRWLV